jgi:hypothetical protein
MLEMIVRMLVVRDVKSACECDMGVTWILQSRFALSDAVLMNNM